MSHKANAFTGKEEKTGWFNSQSQESFVLDYSVQHANYIHLLVQKWHPATFLGVNPDGLFLGNLNYVSASNRPLSLLTAIHKLPPMQNNWETWYFV